MNSKRKGSTFERQMVKEFTKWSGIPFKRNWGVEKQYVGITRGDIVPDYENVDGVKKHPMVLVIECKHREGWILDNLLLKEKSEIYAWIEQVKQESKGTSAYPFLIMKKNYIQPLCAYPISLREDYKKAPKGYVNFHNPLTNEFVWKNSFDSGWIVTPLDSFFKEYSYIMLEDFIKGGLNGK